MRLYFVLCLALAMLPAAVRAQIYTTTSAMPVRIELVGFCTLSASDLNFGAYASNQASPILGQTNLQLQCSRDTVVEIRLDAGTGRGQSTKNRVMELEGDRDRLSYGLFQDPGRTIHWGDRSGNDTLEVVATGEPQSIPVYGQLPGGQRVRDGTYADTITVTVFY
jgi:spore coat protein U-like protein